MPKTAKKPAAKKPATDKSDKIEKSTVEDAVTKSSASHVWRIIGLIAVVILVVGAIIASTTIKPSNFDQVWDAEMTLGSPDAKNYFVVYSDMACPYCYAFENAVVKNEEEFQKYLENNDILYEVRLSDYLYEFGESNPEHSRTGAVAAYCAKNEGKFWDYYNHAIATGWDNYFASQGKSGGYEMAKEDKTYWLNLGKDVGLGDTFISCVENEETLAAVQENAQKTAKIARGMPYYKFNDFTYSGFEMSGDWSDVLNLFQAGLES